MSQSGPSRKPNQRLQPAKVALAKMQRFVGKCAAAIHRKGALATIGSARTSWNWENAVDGKEPEHAVSYPWPSGVIQSTEMLTQPQKQVRQERTADVLRMGA